MSIRGSVGSLIASHRAKSSHPDRSNFLSKLRRLPWQPIFRRAFPFGQMAFPAGQGAFPFAPGALRFGQGAFPFGQTAFSIGQGAFPFGRMAFPFGQGAIRFGQGPLPSGQTPFPFGQGAFPISKGLFSRYLWRFLEFFKRPAVWDAKDPEMYWGNPNLRWAAPPISSNRATPAMCRFLRHPPQPQIKI